MKKLVLLAMLATVLTIFNGCEKDELVVFDEQSQLAIKPEVYVENGYLAFKNMEAVDSVIQMLGKMTTREKEVWENQMGFKSARADFDMLFNEYDKLESYEAFLAFKERNKGKLKFNETDPTDCSIDYPFTTKFFVPVLNNNGIYKVGRTLVKYTIDDNIVVLNGDINKLNNFESFKNDRDVLHNTQLKYGLVRNNITSIHNFPEDNPNGDTTNPWHRKQDIDDRKLKNELYYERYLYYFDDRWVNNQWVPYYENGIRVYLNQRGQKVSWGSWRDYSTSYGIKQIRFQVDSYPEFLDGTTYTSANVNPSINFNLHKHFVETDNVNSTYLDPPTNVYFAAKVTFNGFGFNEANYYNIENPENYSYTGGYYIPFQPWGW
jgi:hypothetical protein